MAFRSKPRIGDLLPFKFIHTADWQLGKPFTQFEDGLAEVLRKARLEMIANLAQLAKEQQVAHVVVAGDVWDQEIPSDQTIRQPLDIMGDAAHVTWWLLPGNHDPARENGLWTRIEAMGCPHNVRPMLSAKPIEATTGVYLLPSPWVSKNPGYDNTTWMDAAVTPDGSIRLGIAHGSVTDFGGDAGQKCVISAFERVQAANLDYLALGDWHGLVSLGDRVGYSGTPETDSFASKEPGWVLIVEIDGQGQIPTIQPYRITRHHWAKFDKTVLPGMMAEDIFGQLTHEDAPRHQTLVRLKLEGQLPISEYTEMKRSIADAKASFAYFDSNLTNLHPILEIDDLDDLDLAGSLRLTAERLMDAKNDESLSQQDRADAARALDLFLSFSQEGASV